MKKYLFLILLFAAVRSEAQKIDSIYVNLYTDSLKKGTYNYINVDGLYSNGSYRPLDSTDIIFTASHGKFYGNSLWLASDFKEKMVSIIIKMRRNEAIKKEFFMYVKQQEDPPLKTEKELMDELKNAKKNKKKDID